MYWVLAGLHAMGSYNAAPPEQAAYQLYGSDGRYHGLKPSFPTCAKTLTELARRGVDQGISYPADECKRSSENKALLEEEDRRGAAGHVLLAYAIAFTLLLSIAGGAWWAYLGFAMRRA